MTKDLKPAAYICRKRHRTVIALDAKRAYPKDALLPEPCAFESSDPAAFEQHIKNVHGGGRRISPTRLPKLKPAGSAPRQSKPFEPTGLEVGATVTWRQSIDLGAGEERVIRSGQVWSKHRDGVWVVPFDEIPDEAEIAVLLRGRPEDGLRVLTTWSSDARVAS